MKVKLSLERELVIGSIEGDEGELFGRISDVQVDQKGNLYVSDLGFQRVQKYAADGGYLGVIGGEGEGPGRYFDPSALATDKEDNIYVASQGRISVFNSQGQYVDEFRTNLSGFVRKIRVRDNAVYVSCLDIMSQQILHKYSVPAGVNETSFCDSYAVGTDEDTRKEMAMAGGSIDIMTNGVIIYTQMQPYEIREYSPEGRLLATIYRDNSFMTTPRVDLLPDGGMTLHAFPMSTSIIALPDNGFLNTVMRPLGDEKSETIIDLFDNSGLLVGTTSVDRAIGIKCSDVQGRLYASERDDFPKVVRYWLKVIK